MKNNIIYIVMLLITLLGVTIIYYQRNYFFEPKEVIASTKEEKVYNSAISMMYETSAGSGEYTETSESSWPTDGYTFNSTLSKCENGGTLTWDDTNKKVLMSSNASDKCYVYFDVKPTIGSTCIGQNMASCIKENYQLDSSILLHNASLTNGANDGSYRYAGSSESVKNYVCFGSDAATCPTDNLYRIIGVFGDQVKLIKSDYATSSLLGTDGDYVGTGTYNSTYKGSLTTRYNYHWNYKAGNSAVNNWTTSLLNKTNLNTNYLNNIGSTWANKIATTTWKAGGNTYANIVSQTAPNAYKNEITSPAESTTYNAKVGLMYVSDYGYAMDKSYWTAPLGGNSSTDYRNFTANNWMYMGEYEWTISRRSDSTNSAFRVYYTGYVFDYPVNLNCAVRPSFYLTSSTVLQSGIGTAADPYRIDTTPSNIAFTINGTSYTTTEGTTWYEWITSNGITDFVLECGDSSSNVRSQGAYYLFDSNRNSYITGDMLIVNNESYSHSPKEPSMC